MTFNSIEFIFFFAIVFVLYFLPAMKTAARQNTLLLVASYVFYGMWDWRFLGLILLTTTSTFFTGMFLMKKKAKWIAGTNIGINLCILAIFKYFNFFGDNLSRLLKLTGFDIDWVFLDIILPVGISFYTFQAIGYTIDAYRDNLKGVPTDNPVMFATFIAYFPQLVAGPIERAKNIIPQLKQTRIWNYEDSVAGLRRILWGAMKKVVIADQCGMHADMIWSLGLDAPHGEIKMFIAVLLFCIQIYCDFSGYCDMALGISQMLGIRLMENFRMPYFSRSILEFWHRWHISLMEWFKQYVYIPLGGSHVSRYRHYMNISIVFIISGLWHGASWCFLLWGIYWGLIYILAIIMKVQTYKDDPDITRHNMSGTICSMSMVITGWAIFRSTSVSECTALLFRSVIPLTIITAVSAMVITKCVNSATMKKIGKWTLITAFISACLIFPAKIISYYYLLYAAGMFACEWAARAKNNSLYPVPCRKPLRYALYIFIYISIVLAPSSDSAFIYFQF